jgi:adenosylcobyric acid synthase
VVGDIDRGGVFASLYGTVALLDDADRALIRGLVINKFRGDVGLLRPGLDRIAELTGVPVLGVLPWLGGVWLDGEDTLQVGRWGGDSGGGDLGGSGDGPEPLRIAVVRFPRLSNATDLDALACEPGVQVTMTTDPMALRSADVVVLPGSRSTVADLEWLRRGGLADAVVAAAASGVPVLGICGGYQMLGQAIDDEVESDAGSVPGLGLLPTTVTFGAAKVLRRTVGEWEGEVVAGYEIHHGIAELAGDPQPFLDGCRAGSVWGTMWHGAFENDGFRRAWLASATAASGRSFKAADGALGFADRRESMIDRLADAVAEHLDTAAVLDLVAPR